VGEPVEGEFGIMTKRATTIEVAYRSPEARASARLQKQLVVEAITWLLVAFSLLISFLSAGQFSREVLIGLGIALAKSLLQAIATYLQHYLSSLSDETSA
jgi:hypothetical protein